MFKIRISTCGRLESLWEFLYSLMSKIRREDLWSLLLQEGNHKLIDKLRRAEKREPGFTTIVVPPEGFSENISTHYVVMSWLKKKKINIVDVNKILDDLTKSLG